MQFRLVSVNAGHVEHQPADLHQAAKIVVHAESIDEYIDGKAIFAAKRAFKVAQVAVVFHSLRVAVTLFGGEVNLRWDINLQKFFAAGIAEHRHHGIVDFDEAAFRRAEKQSLLNVVEQFAIAALGFAAVRDVLENVNGLQALAGRSVHARS